MNDLKEKLAGNIVDFFETYGINPIYAVTIFSVLIVIGYRKEISDWENISDSQKMLVGSAVFGTGIMIIVSLLTLVGIIQL